VTQAWTHTGYAQQIHFRRGVAGDVGRVVKDLGGRRVLLVTTSGRRSSAAGERIVRALGGSLAALYDGVRSHVPTSTVQEAMALARREGVDSVVSFGGGSCADLGKAVCFFTEHESGTPGASFLDRPALPHVAIPTTYSGAELTPHFGMTDEASRRKSGSGGPTIAPVAALYDVDLTLDVPARVSAETGMNALAHCVEAVWSPARTPEAEAVALAGISRIAAALPAVVERPDDVECRADMLAGAVLGGRCLQNATMGVHHGLAQLVGGRTGIPHGLANAILLTHSIRFNEDAVPDDVGRIAAALGSHDAAAAVDLLRERLGLPARLSDVGVGGDDLDAVVRLAESSPSVRANPRPVDEDGARSILEAAF
jgi:maleylacetate reductase